jgi:hypothetical protein
MGGTIGLKLRISIGVFYMPIRVIDDSRTKKIREKYGRDIFQRWGREGGSPILKAYAAKHKKGK